jgi:hypothetical protein
MFKGRLPVAGGMSISIIEADPHAHPITPQDMLLAGLKDVALGLPQELMGQVTEAQLLGETQRPSVDHPQHYRSDSGLEAIEVIEAWDLNFNLGNVVKYVCRAGLKGSASKTEDLEKALWYLQRELSAGNPS